MDEHPQTPPTPHRQSTASINGRLQKIQSVVHRGAFI
jgi:hypothetical protein